MIRFGLVILLSSQSVYALTFQEAVKKIEGHEAVIALKSQSEALGKKSKSAGSWGDPMFKISAKNFPEDSLKRDQTPMTGIEFGLSQKIALTNKYGNLKSKYRSLSKASVFYTKDQKQKLIKELWFNSIKMKQYKEEQSILRENASWIRKVLKSSKKLYSNGKISQQALLDIQIRQSEIERLLSNKKFSIENLKNEIKYLLNDEFDYNTTPWGLLEKKDEKKLKDFQELAIKEKVEALSFGAKAAKKSFMPDVTVSVSYTKRENIDGNGDFIGASLSFPIPVSGNKYGDYGAAVKEKYASVSSYNNFRSKKEMSLSNLKNNIDQVKTELEILKFKSIAFARNSREISFKSYGLGNTSYLELLQSEFKLQELLMKKEKLTAYYKMKIIELKYIKGASLHE